MDHRGRQDQKTHKAIEMLRSGVLMILWMRLSFFSSRLQNTSLWTVSEAEYRDSVCLACS